MSEDYKFFLQGMKKQLDHMKQVYTGDIQEEEQDYSFQALSDIPVLLKSNISVEMKSFLLAQYVEIKGNIRDTALGDMSRESFYNFAAERAEKEALNADEKKTLSQRNFSDLIEYLGEEFGSIIKIIEIEHEKFKSQLSDVIRSKLGIPLDRTVGSKEVEEYQKTVTFLN